jgi:DNA-binding transcriptional LysR family regulator
MQTLRQIEMIRAIMVTGTVGGAARLLNVSSPGVSRVMKHAETSVGVKLFSRKGGRYSPTPQANAIFSQINGVYDKVEDLQFVISRIQRGAETELKIGSVPSITNIMVPRAIADLRKALPNLLIPNDPHGKIMAGLFASHALHYEVTIRARFGSTVCALVSHGLGIAIVDEFTLAADQWPRLRILDVVEPTVFQTYIAHRKDVPLSSHGARFAAALRGQMESAARACPVRKK